MPAGLGAASCPANLRLAAPRSALVPAQFDRQPRLARAICTLVFLCYMLHRHLSALQTLPIAARPREELGGSDLNKSRKIPLADASEHTYFLPVFLSACQALLRTTHRFPGAPRRPPSPRLALGLGSRWTNPTASLVGLGALSLRRRDAVGIEARFSGSRSRSQRALEALVCHFEGFW